MKYVLVSQLGKIYCNELPVNNFVIESGSCRFLLLSLNWWQRLIKTNYIQKAIDKNCHVVITNHLTERLDRRIGYIRHLNVLNEKVVIEDGIVKHGP